MSNGIFTSLSGAMAQERNLEIIANNLANVHTNGYKEDRVSFKVMEAEPEKHTHAPLPPENFKVEPDTFPLIGNEIKYVGIGGFFTDHGQGPLKLTSNPLDFAIEGKAYFETMTEAGKQYTKNSSFTLGPNGILQTHNGHPVQGQKGAVFLSNSDFKVNEEGEIYQNGNLVDRLKIVSFKNEGLLQKTAGTSFIHNGSDDNFSTPVKTRILQGYVEGSNVNPLQNLTKMIMTQRSYEAYQKAMKAHDERMGKAVQLGEVKG